MPASAVEESFTEDSAGISALYQAGGRARNDGSGGA